jgi:penicillin-binding protein 1C
MWEGACPRWRPEGDPLRLPAGSQQALQLKLSALGDSASQGSINASFERLGRYQLSVLDEAGQTARLEFSVVD